MWTDSYSISRGTWIWTKKLFFHLWDLNHSQQCYHSHLLCFKIITKTFQTDDEGPNRRGGKVASTWDDTTTKASPICSLLKRLDVRRSEHWPFERKISHCCVCSTKNKGTRTKFKCSECNVGLCASPVARYVTLTWNWGAYRHVTIAVTELMYFISIFFMK
jgi:hypothetical protein